MIVKNESHIITKCLDSVKPIIDYWVIVDTGSTDGTQALIREYLKEIPGELHERVWQDFATNRNQALELARGKADFLLIMDADDWLAYDDDFKLPDFTHDGYQIKFFHSSGSFYKHLLVRLDLPWYWSDVLHEYLTIHQPIQSTILDRVHYMVGACGSSYSDPEKYANHVHILEEALKKEPTNCRYMFYLADSYRCMGDNNKAIHYYNKRVAMGGDKEGIYLSLLHIAQLLDTEQANLEDVINSYYRAFRFFPHRSEALYYLAQLYNKIGRHDLAYALIKTKIYITQPTDKENAFREEWTENWGLFFQLIASACKLKRYQEAFVLSGYLLKRNDIPDLYHAQISTYHQTAKENQLIKS